MSTAGASDFATRLLEAAGRTSPVCVGLDPVYARLPTTVRERARGEIDAIESFCRGVIDAVAGVVPVVKPQSAYFERYGSAGVAVYERIVRHAKAAGLLVIGDIKRGDIGETSRAYAAGHLLADDAPDAVTVNPMLGPDTLSPWIEAAVSSSRGLFVLVRTSNPGSSAWQDVLLADGRTWSQGLADDLASIAPSAGLSGYGPLGVVVGATRPLGMASLRSRLTSSIFLLPGYGTQGATAAMTRAAFDAAGRGAIVSASRSVLYPGGVVTSEDHRDWRIPVRRAAEVMAADVRGVLGASGVKTSGA